MVRNVVMVKLTAEHDPEEVAAVQEGLRALRLPGTISYTVGDDLGLREGGWSFAIVADFTDEAAYRAYDHDGEHNRLRDRLDPHVDAVARVQYAL